MSSQEFYGFRLVKLYESGVVGVTSYALGVPSPYFAPDHIPARAQPEVFLLRAGW